MSWRRWTAAALGLAAGTAVVLAASTSLPRRLAPAPVVREVLLEARQFAYAPARVRVRVGDTVVLRLRPVDVEHGLYVDGYGQEVQAAPGETAQLQFVADRAGSFRFRCSTTCGLFHPFMIGELVVEPNAPFGAVAGLTLATGAGAVAYAWRKREGIDGWS